MEQHWSILIKHTHINTFYKLQPYGQEMLTSVLLVGALLVWALHCFLGTTVAAFVSIESLLLWLCLLSLVSISILLAIAL